MAQGCGHQQAGLGPTHPWWAPVLLTNDRPRAAQRPGHPRGGGHQAAPGLACNTLSPLSRGSEWSRGGHRLSRRRQTHPRAALLASRAGQANVMEGMLAREKRRRIVTGRRRCRRLRHPMSPGRLDNASQYGGYGRDVYQTPPPHASSPREVATPAVLPVWDEAPSVAWSRGDPRCDAGRTTCPDERVQTRSTVDGVPACVA